MAEDESPKKRGRMVVEEVSDTLKATEKNTEEAMPDSSTVVDAGDEIKDKVEELQEITEHMSEDVEKSADVQEELAEVAEKVVVKPATDVKTYAPYGERSKGPSPLIIIIPGILILGAILGGVYFYQKNLGTTNQEQPTSFQNSATPLPTSSTSPSASPSAKIDLTKYSIVIQNGSGIPGTAASAKDLLVKEGFKVGLTGNADNYEYKETVVKAKASVTKEYLSKLEETLSGMYKMGDSEDLSDSSKDDVIVIIGSLKSE